MKEYAGKILMMVENFFPADARVRNEAFTLSEKGYKVSVIALRGHAEKTHQIVNGISVYRIPKITLFKKVASARRTPFRKILRKVQAVVGYTFEYCYFTFACLFVSLYVAVREGFDVLHVHNPPDTLFLVGAIHKVFGKQFIFDHHDLCPELYLSRYKAKDDIMSHALRLLEKLSLKMADIAIVTNESYRAIDIRRASLNPDKVFVVRNGPDLERVRLRAPDRALAGAGRTILGYIGRMNPQDGVDYLLRALRYLVHEIGRTDVYCVLIGDGDSVDQLKLQAASLAIGDHVLFTGLVSDEDAMRYLSTADICLDPDPSSPLNDVSTWIKIMEYMALAKPIVSFDLKETRTSAGDAAVYVTPNNEMEFARAIAQLMDDPERRRKMGEYGRMRVERDLSWKVVSQNLLLAYNTLFPQSADRGAGQAMSA